jgi:O-6-methylguanine DNA methyltransferase
MDDKILIGHIEWPPVGNVYVAASAQGVLEIMLGAESPVQFIAGVRERTGLIVTEDREFAMSAVPIVEQALLELQEYFAGQRKSFDVTIDYRAMTAFQRSVYECIVQIPAGQMDTYLGVANRLNNPKAIRAVGGALARNPIPIIIPCHRVVGSDGAMIGYSGSGGVETKRLLLKLEGALLF